ncbi:MAG: hypothetical protein QOI99_2352, partial [Actinomycetota bacterium]|nr:hypothetical protein [Actinomycetota bacterium]
VEEGAVAAMSVRTGSSRPDVAEGYATLGAGARVRAADTAAGTVDTAPGTVDTAPGTVDNAPGTAPGTVDPAPGTVDPALPSSAGDGPIVVGDATQLRRSAGRHLPTGPGDLGQALHAAGRRTAVVGVADIPGALTWPTLPRPRPARFRPAALALMDRAGVVDTGVVDPARLLRPDLGAPFGERADPDLVAAATRRALDEADVVLVDTGDLTRVEAVEEVQQQVFADLARTFALQDSDAILGRIVADLPPATLVLVVSVVPPDREWRLTPVVAAGAGVVPGRLQSPSTKRRGLVTLTDLAPTVLAAVGAPVPPEMIGSPLRYGSGPSDIAGLARLDRDAAYRERIYFRVALGFVLAQAVTYALALGLFFRRRQLRSPAAGATPPASSVTAAAPASAAAESAAQAGAAEGAARAGAYPIGPPPTAAGADPIGPGLTGPGLTGPGLTQAGLTGLTGGWRSPAAAASVLRLAVVAFAAFPLATFLFRAVPFAPAMGGAGVAVLLALDAAVVALAVRARRHPLSPLAWVMGATVVVLVADVATGARLQTASILGYSPHTAARFYGLGNSAFAVLAGASILAAALHLEHAPRRREAVVAVAALFALVLVADGAPSLGDDVGGILTLAPVFALALVAFSGRRLTWRAVAAALAVTVVVLGGAVTIELLRPPEARTHLGRVVADTLAGRGQLSTTLARKAEANLRVLRSSVWAWVVPIVAAFVFGLLVWLTRIEDLLPARSPLRIGVAAAAAAGILGFAVNDSGVVVTALVLVFVAPVLTLVALDAGRGRERPMLLEPALDLEPSQPTEVS